MSTISKNPPPTLTSSNQNLTAAQTKDLAKINKDYAAAQTPASKAEKVGEAFGIPGKHQKGEMALKKDLAKLSKDGFDSADVANIASQMKTGDTAGKLATTMGKTNTISDVKSTAQINSAFAVYARNNGVAPNAQSYANFSTQLKTDLQQKGVPDTEIDAALAKSGPSSQQFTAASLAGNIRKA